MLTTTATHGRPAGAMENRPLLTRAYLIAWAFALVFYFLEYAVRSAPAVMLPQLSAAFRKNAVRVSTILGTYYYTYSITSLIAGVLLDRAGAKYAVPAGVAILGIGCILFALPHPVTGYAGRLLQGIGSAFAFTGAVYLASHGFHPGDWLRPSALPNAWVCWAAQPASSSLAPGCNEAWLCPLSGLVLAPSPW